MSNTAPAASGGIGFTGLLTIVFITLKLTGFITWSWWWVLSPVLITVGLVFVVIAMLLFAAIITGIRKGIRK